MTGVKRKLLSSAEAFSGPLTLLPDRFRIGRGYTAALRDIERFDAESLGQKVSATFERLKAIVRLAHDEIPFYRRFYEQRGFDPGQLRTLDDWNRVPIVTKQDFQTVPLEERCSRKLEGRVGNTGGTSGNPLVFKLPHNAVAVEWAHMHTLWKARGYRTSSLKLRIGGTYFEGNEAFRFHPRHNELIVNANSPMSEVVGHLLRQIERHRVRWIHGYPSLVAEFAHALAKAGDARQALFRGRLHGVLLGSEYPAPVYRDAISSALSDNVLSWYGHSEMALLAGETASGIYQSLPTYGYAEAVPTADGGSHRLVSSSLHNMVHPFIRYDTGDLIEPVAQTGAALAFRIKEGRVGDFVLDRAGRRLGLTSIIFGRHHTAFDTVQHLQVRQHSPGQMTILIVPQTDNDLQSLKAGFDFSGLDLDWDLELIAAPIRSAGGKVKLKVDG
jgi:phenylacetate-CoA ligase